MEIDFDRENVKEPQPWIIENLMAYLEDKDLDLGQGLLTEQLQLELMDVVE